MPVPLTALILFSWIALWAPSHARAAAAPAVVTFCRAGGLDLRLNLYRPAERRLPTPAVLLIHGGGMVQGKADGSFSAETIQGLLAVGYTVMAINYRLALVPGGIPWETVPDAGSQYYRTGAQWPAAMEDVLCAVRWAKHKARELNIDKRKLVLLGESTGGGLALVAGMGGSHFQKKGDLFPLAQTETHQVAAIVDWFGSTDYFALAAHQEETLGGSPLFAVSKKFFSAPFGNFFPEESSSADELYRSASAVNYVDKNVSPILILHGTRDTIHPVSEATNLKGLLDAAGARSQMVLIPNAEHSFCATTFGCLFSDNPFRKLARATTLQWLAKIMAGVR